MNIRYFGSALEPKASFEDIESGRSVTLIWGDAVQVLDDAGDKVKAFARDCTGLLDKSLLSDQSLLEIYVIDIGQGDSVLIRTPNDKWHLIDGGVAASRQMTKKGAANFLRWKFQTDMGRTGVELQNVILTHPDSDHFGGLVDIMRGKLADGRTFPVRVENFYHSGLPVLAQSMANWGLAAGTVAAFPAGTYGVKRAGKFITNLLDGASDFASPAMPFADEFAVLAGLVGSVPNQVRAISRDTGYMPGYDPAAKSGVTITVLGPVLEEYRPGKKGLRYLGSEALTRNGHSVVLRLDYGKARILMTGDLNAKSQRLLLSYVPSSEFAVDVTKACHHGAEDVDFDFLRAINACATVISSGDNEDYSHPRPALLGASGFYGREPNGTKKGQKLPPLVYSTELARSVKLCSASAVQIRPAGEPAETPDIADTWVLPSTGTKKYRALNDTPLSNDLIYGLVNIRSDGQFVMCATREEKGLDFDVQVFRL